MAGGVCPFTFTRHLLYHVFLTGVLLIVVIVQGVLLDIFILKNDHTAIQNYFWLVPDFLLVFGFVAAMASGYKTYKAERLDSADKDIVMPAQNKIRVYHQMIMGKHYLPFYVWIIYSVLLVAKIAIIFKSEIPNTISENDPFSPQLIHTAMSLTFIIFALLVEGQVTADRNSERDLYIKSLSHGTAVEILDSVTFLSLLIQSDSRFVMPLNLESAIIFFGCLNFLLPAILLIKLSRSNFGQNPVCIISSVLYKMFHLLFINFTYLVIRVYLWGGFSLSVSPFIVKNIYHIISILVSVWAEAKPLMDIIKEFRNRKRQVHDTVDGKAPSPTDDIELSPTVNSTNWGIDSDKFEEIDLKGETSTSDTNIDPKDD